VLAPYVLPELLATCAARHPGLRLDTYEVDLDVLAQGVISGRFELGLGYELAPDPRPRQAGRHRRRRQNPSMGEVLRRGWHPEFIRAKQSDARVLIVGAGPAGLEAARALGVRGYDAVLAEAGRQLGGRVAKEAWLPGLAAWIRVLDYREQALSELESVEIYPESAMSAADIIE